MAINLGTGAVSKLFLGTSEIQRVYLGNNLVYNAWSASFTGAPYSSSQSSTFISPVFAEIRVASNGIIFRDGTQTGSVNIGSWTATTTPEIRFVVTSSAGTVTNTASSFVSLSSNRFISVESTASGPGGQGFVNGTIELRQPGQTNVVTASFSLSATDQTNGGFGI